MSKYKRREFLKAGIFSSIALNTPFLSACIETNSKKESKPIIKKSKVAIVKGNNLDSITRDSIDAIGGIQSIIAQGDVVFIKPNFVSFPWAQENNCFAIGECTKPEIIIAVTEECLKAGASKVIIGEGSHLPTFEWKYAITFDGKRNLVGEAKKLSAKYDGVVELACLEEDSPEWIEIPSITPHRKIAISSLVANADKVISLPVAKTHSWSQLTLGTKNFLGITPLSRYAQWVDNSWWNRGSFDHSSPKAIGQVFLDITKSIKPNLTIVDFSVGIERDGPTLNSGGKTINVKDKLGKWAVVASTDIMAADATSTRLMDHEISKIKQLSMGFEMGLGEIREEGIEIIGESIMNMTIPWRKARLK
ncbi:MAG: DUF362 domain-containing protein [Draconibacterium sp.]|nr:DUF362 domain-containing protein [Draconibacterium sp.]